MAIVAYTVGFNPHISKFDGFCRRIWGKTNIDKVILIKKGIFLIQFLNNETKSKALKMSNILCDNKPVFVNQWQDCMDYDSAEFHKVPIWVHLPHLPVKYWGTALPKIVGLIGEPIRADAATMNRDRIGFAKFLVEMDVRGEFPDEIKFMSETEVLTK